MDQPKQHIWYLFLLVLEFNLGIPMRFASRTFGPLKVELLVASQQIVHLMLPGGAKRPYIKIDKLFGIKWENHLITCHSMCILYKCIKSYPSYPEPPLVFAREAWPLFNRLKIHWRIVLPQLPTVQDECRREPFSNLSPTHSRAVQHQGVCGHGPGWLMNQMNM